jgi:hypothetical protein
LADRFEVGGTPTLLEFSVFLRVLCGGFLGDCGGEKWQLRCVGFVVGGTPTLLDFSVFLRVLCGGSVLPRYSCDMGLLVLTAASKVQCRILVRIETSADID